MDTIVIGLVALANCTMLCVLALAWVRAYREARAENSRFGSRAANADILRTLSTRERHTTQFFAMLDQDSKPVLRTAICDECCTDKNVALLRDRELGKSDILSVDLFSCLHDQHCQCVMCGFTGKAIRMG